MLKPKYIKPDEYISQSYQNKIVLEEVDKKIALVKNFINNKTNNQQESNLDISNFLNELLYKNNYKIEEGKHFKNSSGELDLTITDTQQEIHRYGVILELKNSNSLDMISKDSFFKKSFYQSVYYYKSDKKDNSNTSKVKFIIITNNIKWFFIKISDLEDAIENKIGINQDNLKYPNTKDKNTADIYLLLDTFFKNICEKPTTQTSLFDIVDNHIDVELPFTFFDLKEIDFKNNNEDFELFLKFLSDSYLFDKVDTVEKNSLDKKFYNELLYIIGLSEIKKGGKLTYIQLDNNFSFLALTQKAILKKDKKISKDELYELSLELVLLWINRLIFIQLYSSILIKYKIINKPILNDETTSFDQIEMLFSEVLQGDYETSTFEHIPYINSTLFVQEKCEFIISINQLNNEIKSTYFNKTVLMQEQLDENDNILKYLIKFLNSCDVVADDNFITSNMKLLINPSILGKIFEKFNGYKDGSYYTPSYITEYIANTTIEKAIIQKFQDNGFESLGIENLRKEIYLDDKQSIANGIFDSITICDPAVGSGHFLVSALNAMVLYKCKLGLLEYFKPSQIEIVDDTLTINNLENYSKENAKEDSKIQSMYEEIYVTKQKIISNSLFGVDINPKSVYIARLRLWIELLKHIHYSKKSNYERFVLLPNIDINIKQGNSLVSDFDLDYEFDTLFEPDFFKKYKNLIKEYKNPDNDRDEIREKIIEIKNKLDSNFENKNKFEWRYEIPEVLDDDGRFIGFDVVIGNPPYGIKLSTREKKYFYNNYKTAEYQLDTYALFIENAHKLLKEDGGLGYIVPSTWLTMFYFKDLRKYLIDNTYFERVLLFRYQVFADVTAETSIITLSKSKTQNKNIPINYYDKLEDIEKREYNNISQNEWANSYELGFNLLFGGDKLKVITKIVRNTIEMESIVDVPNGIKPYETGKGTPKQSREDLKNRIYDADYKVDETYKNYIVGGSINKFLITPSKTDWIKFGDNLAAPRKNFNFFQTKIMVRQTSDRIISAIDYEGLLSLNNVHNIVMKNDIYRYEILTCLLNSKLMDFYYKFLVPEEGRTFAEVKAVNLKRLPIKNIDNTFNQQPFIDKSNQMYELNKKLQETKQNFINELELEKTPKKLQSFESLEFEDFVKEYKKAKKIKFIDKYDEKNFKTDWQNIFEDTKKETLLLQSQINLTDKEIDTVVYKLYELNDEEIKIIEESCL